MLWRVPAHANIHTHARTYTYRQPTEIHRMILPRSAHVRLPACRLKRSRSVKPVAYICAYVSTPVDMHTHTHVMPKPLLLLTYERYLHTQTYRRTDTLSRMQARTRGHKSSAHLESLAHVGRAQTKIDIYIHSQTSAHVQTKNVSLFLVAWTRETYTHRHKHARSHARIDACSHIHRSIPNPALTTHRERRQETQRETHVP